MEDTGQIKFEVEFSEAVPVDFSIILKAETDKFTLNLSTQHLKINGIESILYLCYKRRTEWETESV
jgi:hypothetical protein